MENVKNNRGGVNTRSSLPSSEIKNKYTNQDLVTMQNWSLERKIQVAQTRILEWYQHYNGQVYISFSGGKDSTVLADLAARICKTHNYKLILWFSNTGLEYPEIVRHVKSFSTELESKYEIPVELIVDTPKDRRGKRITFKQVVLTYGYPIISKEVSKAVKDARSAIRKGRANESLSYNQLNGTALNPQTGEKSSYNKHKWKFLLDAPFKISHWCCQVMKKNPAHKFETKTGLKPIIGTMATESALRKRTWLKEGCNSFDSNNPASKPLSFWTEQDVLEYISTYSIPIASVYGDVCINEEGKYYTSGCQRTGCIFCAFGCHMEEEPNRFQQLKQTHPKLWKYCMKSIEEGGLGMKEVLEFINVKIE